MFSRVGTAGLFRQFGQLVTYYPADGSTPRRVEAMVETDTLTMVDEIGDQVSQAITIRVRNQKCNGITGEEVDTGGDAIELPLSSNGTEVSKRSIVRVANDSNGILRVFLQ